MSSCDNDPGLTYKYPVNRVGLDGLGIVETCLGSPCSVASW